MLRRHGHASKRLRQGGHLGPAIFLAPGANAVTTANAVQQTLQKAAARFPPGLKYLVQYDSTTFVRETISEVLRTLFEAFALVVLVVWMAMGLHLNGHQHGLFSLHTRIPHLDVVAEILNVTAKTLWGLGYFLPLLRQTSRDERVVTVAADATRGT